MRQTVVLQMVNQDMIKGEVDTLPNRADQFMILHNPEQPDGSKLSFVDEGVKTILVSWHQILYVQLFPGTGRDMPISFIRE